MKFKTKKAKILLSILIICVLSIGSFYGYQRYKIYKFYRKDAVYLLDFLENNYPYFEVKEKTLNYKFLDHKDEFIKKIAKSKDDADFFKNVDAVMHSLQNCHSRILDNDIMLNLINNKSIIEKNHYFLLDIMLKSIYFPDIQMKYIQGKYIVTKSLNHDIPIGSIITKINGQKINDYIKSKKDTFYLEKDFKRNLFYSDNCYYKYDSIKDTVNCIYDSQEKTAEINYYSTTPKIKKFYNIQTSQSNEKSNNKNVTTAMLNNGKTAYLRIKSFLDYKPDENTILDFFKKCSNVNNIIIDIRGNGGGSDAYGNFLIECLTDKKISMTYFNCIKDTDFMKKTFSSNLNFQSYDKEIKSSDVPLNNYNLDTFKLFKNTYTLEPRYDSLKFKGNIYVLVDNSVYSASENFINIVKESGFAKIIGTTTGGDGTGYGPVVNYLPNTKLAIQIPPTFTISEDGTVNEEIHTKPDIYIEQSLEDYEAYLESGLTDITGSKYDTVFNKTLEIINN